MLRINGPRDPVGAINLPAKSSQTPALAACSVLTGRVVVSGQSPYAYVSSMSMIALSDVHVIYQRTYPNPLARIVPSHEGPDPPAPPPTNATPAPLTPTTHLPPRTASPHL